jgi:hypothetical protein
MLHRYLMLEIFPAVPSRRILPIPTWSTLPIFTFFARARL